MPGRARCSVILPSETQSREFDAKLLLACALAERGLPTYVGSRIAIHNRINLFPHSVYVAKDFRKPSHRMFRILNGLGHRIVAWDEEGILFFNMKLFHERRIYPPSYRYAEELFAWGPQNAEFLRLAPGYENTPIHLTGNPRVDMMRAELRSFHDPDVNRLQDKYDKFILINTNFGQLNHFVSGYVVRPVSGNASTGAKPTLSMEGVWTHRTKILEAFRTMLPRLAEHFPDRQIIVRPHPAENHATWKQAAMGRTNVKVIHEGPVHPWLLACDVMIHNGCTTGIEAYLLSNPAISFSPVRATEYDLPLADNLSFIVGSEHELYAAIAMDSEGRVRSVGDKRELLQEYFSALDGRLAIDRITDVISDFVNTGRDGLDTTLSGVSRAHLDATLRRATKAAASFIPGHKNSHAYSTQRFPGISVDETNERIRRLSSVLGRFSKISARHVDRNIFLVS